MANFAGKDVCMGAIQGPDNIPQRDTTTVNKNGESLADNIARFKELAREQLDKRIEEFFNALKAKNAETEIEARKNAELSDAEKLSSLRQIYDKLKEISSDKEDINNQLAEITKKMAELEQKIVQKATWEEHLKELEEMRNRQVTNKSTQFGLPE